MFGKRLFPTGRIVRGSTFPPRGKSAANRWRPRFSRNRAPPHRRHRFAATKICASCFATSLPQDSSAQLMFDLGEIPAARLKPFAWFGILRRPVLRLARRAVVDAAQVAVRTRDFARMRAVCLAMRLKRFRPHAFSLRPRAARTPLPSLCRNAPEVCRKTWSFHAKCAATFQATRVKPFNRRPVSWARRPTPQRNSPLNPPRSSPYPVPAPAHAAPARSAPETVPPDGRRRPCGATATPRCRRAAR